MQTDAVEGGQPDSSGQQVVRHHPILPSPPSASATDLVKSSGEWVSSVDLANALTLDPAASEAAVVAVPDDTWQERPLAWLRLDADVTGEELWTFLATTLPRFWLPDRGVRVDEIPKTARQSRHQARPSGKHGSAHLGRPGEHSLRWWRARGCSHPHQVRDNERTVAKRDTPKDVSQVTVRGGSLRRSPDQYVRLL
ncbi:hypothetical protein ACFTZB_28510 [Rhodococcus sp. NPDC057014]|uniref:AMP-binding enzyme n=1 Tax=Rhodococcus sp. NPDC057014 TaxID=3346000 RepID=UPI003644D403